MTVQVIPYYIPAKFIAARPKWIPAELRGKVLRFQTRTISRTCEQIAATLASRWVSFTPR